MSAHDDILGRLEAIFTERGAEAYIGEPVTVAEHMLQCGAMALAEDAPEPLVAAALLHDIGQIANSLGEYTPEDTHDRRHEIAGAAMLDGVFPPLVVACVRLHVPAKRYLCAVDAAYYDKLSAASKHTLALQGGPMDEAETEAFEALPFHKEAVQVRRWDDAGKIEDEPTPTFADFKPLLKRVLEGA